MAVTSAAGLVKTDDANVSEVIQNKFVRDLPIEGRSFLNYAQIVPMFNSGTGDNSRVAWGLASATSTGSQAVERRRHRIWRRLLHRRFEQQRQLGGRPGHQRQHGRGAGSES